MHCRSDPIDRQRPFDVPRQVVTLQLDLDAHETIPPNPFIQRFRQAVANGRLDVAGLERIESADAVKHRNALLPFRQHRPIEPHALKIGPQITRHVMCHQIRAVGVVDVAAVNFSERIVERRVEGTGDDERAQLGDGFGERTLRGNLRSGLQTLGLENMRDVEWMPDLGAVARQPRDARRQRFHGLERRVVRHRGRRKRPHVAQRHRREAPGGLSVSRGDAAVNVQQRGAVDNAAAELVRRAVHVVFVAVNDFVDADIGGFRRDDRSAKRCGRRRTCGASHSGPLNRLRRCEP